MTNKSGYPAVESGWHPGGEELGCPGTTKGNQYEKVYDLGLERNHCG